MFLSADRLITTGPGKHSTFHQTRPLLVWLSQKRYWHISLPRLEIVCVSSAIRLFCWSHNLIWKPQRIFFSVTSTDHRCTHWIIPWMIFSGLRSLPSKAFSLALLHSPFVHLCFPFGALTPAWVTGEVAGGAFLYVSRLIWTTPALKVTGWMS